MKTTPQDGGPAFPQTDLAFEVRGEMQGMSLRDWFAAAALAHIPELLDAHEKNKSAAMIANWSYDIADAMLAAREPVKQLAHVNFDPEEQP